MDAGDGCEMFQCFFLVIFIVIICSQYVIQVPPVKLQFFKMVANKHLGELSRTWLLYFSLKFHPLLCVVLLANIPLVEGQYLHDFFLRLALHIFIFLYLILELFRKEVIIFFHLLKFLLYQCGLLIFVLFNRFKHILLCILQPTRKCFNLNLMSFY